MIILFRFIRALGANRIGLTLIAACFPSVSLGAVSAPSQHHGFGIVGEQSQYVLKLSPTDADQSTNVRYRPNVLVTSGFQATFYDLTLEYKTSVGRNVEDDLKKGVTSYDDVRLSLTAGAKSQWLIGTYYTRYAGLYVENSSEVDPAYSGGNTFIQRGDISIFNYGFSLMYVWSPERFSLAAALSQSARQTESGGSLLLMTAFDGTQFYANSSFIPAIKQNLFGQDADLRSARFSTASMAVGYGYTLTSGTWFLTGMLLTGPGHHWRQYTVSTTETTSSANASKFFVGASAGYNGDWLYSALVFTDAQTEITTQSIRIQPEFQQLRWILGFRF